MTKKSILVVDDEVSIRKSLAKFLERERFLVTSVRNAEEALSVSREHKFDLAIVDLNLPDSTGIDLIEKLQKINTQTSAITITGYATVESAIEATKRGVFHYVTKPFNLDEVLTLVQKALKMTDLSVENERLKTNLKQKYTFENFVGDSPCMVEIFKLIERVADTDSTVLVTGESGTGKELVARALHYNSSRSKELFVPVNCGAIPAGLLESELFGHVKGAFTGATQNRIGRFQAASKGTLFLDEAGEMSADIQVKLLRVLQQKRFEMVGSIKEIEADARIVAATNIDLEEAVINRSFREDLFYRLNVIPITMPSLKQRKEDIPLLIHHFSQLFNEEKKCDVSFNRQEVLDCLMSYAWPGNVRELENLIQRLTILKGSGAVELCDLPRKFFDTSKNSFENNPYDFMNFEIPEEGLDFKSIVTKFEDHLLKQALDRTEWNKNKASELLSMNRTTLVEKIKKRQFIASS